MVGHIFCFVASDTFLWLLESNPEDFRFPYSVDHTFLYACPRRVPPWTGDPGLRRMSKGLCTRERMLEIDC